MFELIDSYQELKENVRAFNYELEKVDKDFIRFLSMYHQWYYLPDLELFGPSKFIGYKKMTAQRYIRKKGCGADGRETEDRIRDLFLVEVETDVEIHRRLDTLLRSFGKKKRKDAGINRLSPK